MTCPFHARYLLRATRNSIFIALSVLLLCGCVDDSPTIDGYTYKTVKIGDQEWFAESLKTTVYANGDEIPYSRTDESWTTLEEGMRCSYDHEEAMNAKYGQLYNWYAVDDERGLCPTKWHVPSEEDWKDLEVFLGMSRVDVSLEGDRGSGELGIGTKLKARGGWQKDGNGKDDIGFSALPGGYRTSFDGKFYNDGFYGYWWSSSPNGGSAWYRYLNNYGPAIVRVNSVPKVGLSVRCLRDAD